MIHIKNIMRKNIFLLLLIILLPNLIYSQTNFSQFVNPFIGTGGHGHTYPGATLPGELLPDKYARDRQFQ